MPALLIVALAGSLLIHGLALFGTEFAIPGEEHDPPALQAELVTPPAPPAPSSTLVPPPVRPPAAVTARSPEKSPKPQAILPSAPVSLAGAPSVVAEETGLQPPDVIASAPAAPAPEPIKPALPASGLVRFAIFRGSRGFQIGQAEHRWEFADDGAYRLTATSETNGLVALLRPVRMVQESRGRLLASGLQPESYRSLREGRPPEGADFDWSLRQLRLLRDGSMHPLPSGAQDLLSLNYQLAYLGRLADGVVLGVATARKFERHALDSLGEEEIEVPAGRFRTLHLRALNESTTEIWIALDHGSLPVKIRFTDKKGDRYEQVATELGN
ncbi:MAG: DUF3108 domain-containing protein [Dechloromonas sp.]|nr:MAG: DUF3108 domain-containing protein [Dechloromonas sp.]